MSNPKGPDLGTSACFLGRGPLQAGKFNDLGKAFSLKLGICASGPSPSGNRNLSVEISATLPKFQRIGTRRQRRKFCLDIAATETPARSNDFWFRLRSAKHRHSFSMADAGEETAAQRQARIRREKREAKIKAGGTERLEKITKLSGRTPQSSMSIRLYPGPLKEVISSWYVNVYQQ